MSTISIKVLSVSILIFLLSACDKREQESNDTLEIKMLANSYVSMIQSSYGDFKSNATQLDLAMNDWYFNMDGLTFIEMQDSWRKTMESYNKLGPFLHTNNSANPLVAFHLKSGLLVTNPSFIDETLANPTSGIIPNATLYPTISSFVINDLHLAASSDNVTLGLHAIELIIWGEDNNASGPGTRITFDFENFGTSTKARRKQYLKEINQSLNFNLETLNLNLVEKEIYSLSPDECLSYILSGAYRFVKNDFAEKTIKKPYDTQSQLLEESPYSDNTINDIKNKIIGLKNFMFGSTFESSNSYFLMDFIQKKSPEVHDQIEADLAALETETNNLLMYFDNGLTSSTERAKYLKIYNLLISISNSISDFATSEGISI
jgi:putative iron-regulated protein